MARIRWTGLSETKADLLVLGETMNAEARHLVQGGTNAAATAIRTEYGKHRRSGTLQERVRVIVKEESAVRTHYEVRNTAPHADIIEHGTEARHTDLGADRGSMPAGNIFIPAMMRARRTLNRELAAMMQRHGLTVTGAF